MTAVDDASADDYGGNPWTTFGVSVALLVVFVIG